MDERKMLAKWLSGGGAHWCELYRYPGQNGLPDWFGYVHRNGAGSLGSAITNMTEERAVMVTQDRVDLGWFAPDVAVNPLKRVA
jgi:hypothetical protein